MKLLRHGPLGQEKPGAIDAKGQLRDLSLLVPDFTPEWLSPERELLNQRACVVIR